MGNRHTILLVEDDEATAAEMKEIIESLGFDHIHAFTAEEAEALITYGGFCAAVIDVHIKANSRVIRPLRESGERVLRFLRATYPWRDERDKHVMQALMVSEHATHREDAVRMLQYGANDYLVRMDGSERTLGRALTACLRHSGRYTHAHCDAIDMRYGITSPTAETVKTVRTAPERKRLLLTARRANRRMVVIVDDEAVTPVRPSTFTLLVGVKVGRCRSTKGWMPRDEVGAGGSGSQEVCRAREDLDDSEIIETHREWGIRLDPRVAIEVEDLDELVNHEDAVVRKFAKELRGRSGGA